MMTKIIMVVCQREVLRVLNVMSQIKLQIRRNGQRVDRERGFESGQIVKIEKKKKRKRHNGSNSLLFNLILADCQKLLYCVNKENKRGASLNLNNMQWIQLENEMHRCSIQEQLQPQQYPTLNNNKMNNKTIQKVRSIRIWPLTAKDSRSKATLNQLDK